MGNRLTKSSPRFGIPRDTVKDREAFELYRSRATGRPKQTWDSDNKKWIRV